MVNPEWADLDQGLFSISVAAELAGLHPQTLRIYEREGLLDPVRSAGGTRRYSRNDITRLHEICTLTGDGLNVAGIRRVLELQEETQRLKAELARLKHASRGQPPADRAGSGQHLLDRLPGDAHLAGDVGLGETVRGQAADQVTALGVQLLRQPEVLQRLRADLLETAERFLVGIGFWVLSHEPSLTTPCCQCQPLVVTSGGRLGLACPLPAGQPRAYSTCRHDTAQTLRLSSLDVPSSRRRGPRRRGPFWQQPARSVPSLWPGGLMSGSRRPATAPGRVSYDDGVLRISRRAGARLVLAGEIDEETYPALVSSLGEVAAGAAEVHIDLSAVRYCDLAGLRAMIRLAGPGRRRVVLHGIPEQLDEVLRVLGWDGTPGLIVHRPA